ncbi:putative N-acetylated-alpha-linked acidic dipeptidase [Anneissia japonica]|uniref:putative N-acetylated-alpha-linked acidic dipeptidase n=1 Tax=Anneissia japonica TaxID=1529436 RepID=UPI00142582D2|nr:putative N-acetylated-alpha-linked acidic dipeptidase [Anneissia japonica]
MDKIGLDVDINDGKKKSFMSQRFIVYIVCVGTFCLGLGLLLGYLTFPETLRTQSSSPIEGSEQRDHEWVSETLMNYIDAAEIEENLRYLSKRPHVGGTQAEKENAEYIKEKWIEHGLDGVKINAYTPYLSYPDINNPNKVFLLDNGNEFFSSRDFEDVLRPEDDSSDILPPFNAYSAQGTVEGELVYVNFGREQDFIYLAENKPEINIAGKIVIAKFAKGFRGTKVNNAQKAGAIGVILYSDPDNYSPGDTLGGYPNSWWLPRTGAQRGNVWVSDAKGDPLTPGFPANDYAYRQTEEHAGLPRIPVHCICADDAERILREMGGDDVPDSWIGGLNISYKFGPTFKNPNRTVKLEVTSIKENRPVYNVIGMIKGKVEPDRYILLGNHRDAWTFGAIDPSSGTSALLEMTRAFGRLHKDHDWSPRRTILFCSWAAEEPGLAGSTEFLEDFQRVLAERTVVYFNVDSAVTGNYTFQGKSTPSLRKAIFAATKKVPSPDSGFTSTYEHWKEKDASSSDNSIPYLRNLGSGSDYKPYTYRLGIPAADVRWRYPTNLGLSSHPVYHSAYSTFYYVKTFLDWDFKRHQAVARVWTELGRDFADSTILPFDCVYYADKIRSSIETVKDLHESNMNAHNITFDTIMSAIDNLTNIATSFEAKVQKMDTSDVLEVRKVNDQFMLFERAFIDPLGLPGRKFMRHVIFSPTLHGGSSFPGIVDSMYRINEDPDQDQRWEAVREHMAVVAFMIQSAASTLKDVTEF